MIDNTQTTLYPGGILNTGFALSLGQGPRARRAAGVGRPAASSGRYKRIQGGDKTCEANQALHAEAVDLIGEDPGQQLLPAQGRRSARPDHLRAQINAPVFLACQWTDEQTGGHCPSSSGASPAPTQKWFTFTNGAHIDSLDPATFNRWYDFLELYVAQRAPQLTAGGEGARAGDLPSGDGRLRA